MPLTKKGQEILANMRRQYGDKKGTSVFYASRNAGTISGVEAVAKEQAARTQRRAAFLAGRRKGR